MAEPVPPSPPEPGRCERFERCWCTGVDRELVIAAIRTHRCRTIDQVRRHSGACFGCQSCRPELEGLLAEVWALAETGTDRIAKPPG